jgi:hypothetical protein
MEKLKRRAMGRSLQEKKVKNKNKNERSGARMHGASFIFPSSKL